MCLFLETQLQTASDCSEMPFMSVELEPEGSQELC